MGMTMTQKILAAHAGVDSVKAGDLITCSLDLVMANDITAPPSIAEFKRIGRPVFDKDKIVLVPDHFQPAKDIKSAGLAKIVRDFAREHHIIAVRHLMKCDAQQRRNDRQHDIQQI